MAEPTEFSDVADQVTDKELAKSLTGRIIQAMEDDERREAEIHGHILAAWVDGELSRETVVAHASADIMTTELERWLD